MTVRRFFGSTVEGSSSLVLFDSFTEINSLKLRIPTYTGPLAQIERLSDNTTLDIYPDDSGYADESDIAAFCSGTTGRYRIIYGQKGVNDITQTTFAQMPYCYLSGTVTKLDGFVAMDFNNTENLAMQYGTGLESINSDGFFFLLVAEKLSTNSISQQLLSHSLINRQFRIEAGGGENLGLIGGGAHLRNFASPAVTSKIKGFKVIDENAESILMKGESDGTLAGPSGGTPTSYVFNQIGRRSSSSEIFSGKIIEIMYKNAYTADANFNETEIRSQLVTEYD